MANPYEACGMLMVSDPGRSHMACDHLPDGTSQCIGYYPPAYPPGYGPPSRRVQRPGALVYGPCI